MQQTSRKKLFAAEKALLRKRGQPIPPPGPEPGATALDDLRREIQELKGLIEGGALGDTSELQLLQGELQDMGEAISQTKHEIAAIRHPNAAEPSDDRLMAAAMELDAIVQATEVATQNILQSSETVLTLAEDIQNRNDDPAVAGAVGSIVDEIMKIFENCNFQDITGQRIGKVIKIIDYLEERIQTMIGIWGASTFAEVDVAEGEPGNEADKLLAGPQLENQGLSQDDIDSLFD